MSATRKARGPLVLNSRQRRRLAAATHKATRKSSPTRPYVTRAKGDGFDAERIARAEAKRRRKAEPTRARRVVVHS